MIKGWGIGRAINSEFSGIDIVFHLEKNGIEKILEGNFWLSMGYEIKEAECSICNSDYFNCEHIRGFTYNGQIARLVVKKVDLKDISLVKEPDDANCKVQDLVIESNNSETFWFELMPNTTRQQKHKLELFKKEGALREKFCLISFKELLNNYMKDKSILN